MILSKHFLGKLIFKPIQSVLIKETSFFNSLFVCKAGEMDPYFMVNFRNRHVNAPKELSQLIRLSIRISH